MDANFRLKNRLRTSSRLDPGLGTGWAYFVPEQEYAAHILKYVTQEEVRFAYPMISVVLASYRTCKILDQHLFRIRSAGKRESKKC